MSPRIAQEPETHIQKARARQGGMFFSKSNAMGLSRGFPRPLQSNGSLPSSAFFLIMTLEHVAFACQGNLADSMADARSVVFLPWKMTKGTQSCLQFLAGVTL